MKLIAIPALLALAACGGGSSSSSAPVPAPDPVPLAAFLADPDATPADARFLAADSRLRSVSVDAADDSITFRSGDFIYPDRLRIDAFTGTIADPAEGSLFLDTGGTADLVNQIDTDHVLWIKTGTEVGGLGAPATAMPLTGPFAYSGASYLQLVLDSASGGAIYELAGGATVSGLFDTGRATVRFSEMSGRVIDPAADTLVSPFSIDGTTLSVVNAVVIGTVLEGGIVSFDNRIAPLSAAAVKKHSGQFFGPSAAEVAGVVAIDDRAAGLNLVGTYIAN